jgi:transcriptional regulator with XRE-family HTH domain
MKRANDLLTPLRKVLRAAGWTIRSIAGELQVGEATVKRWLAGKGLTLDRFDQLAELAGTSVAELARQAERPDERLVQELTLAQERTLSQDEFLAFLFMVILAGYSWQEVAGDFNVPQRQMEAALIRLERLALIDRLPGGRVRPLVDRAIIWRKTPMRSLFEQRMKPQFLAMDFAAEEAVYASEVIKLSAQGAAMLAELIEKHRRDVQALAERDRAQSHLPRAWHGMLCAMRPLDTTGLRQG